MRFYRPACPTSNEWRTIARIIARASGDSVGQAVTSSDKSGSFFGFSDCGSDKFSAGFSEVVISSGVAA
jgi:hypothetical protein